MLDSWHIKMLQYCDGRTRESSHFSHGCIDDASPRTGALPSHRGRHKEGILMNDAGVIDPEVEKSMEFETVNVSPGDLVLFDSYLPHRSGAHHLLYGVETCCLSHLQQVQ